MPSSQRGSNGKKRAPRNSDDDTDFSGTPDSDGDDDSEGEPGAVDMRELQPQEGSGAALASQQGKKPNKSIQTPQKANGPNTAKQIASSKKSTPIKTPGKQQQGSSKKPSASVVKKASPKGNSSIATKTTFIGKSVKGSRAKQSTTKAPDSSATKARANHPAIAPSKPSSAPAKQKSAVAEPAKQQNGTAKKSQPQEEVSGPSTTSKGTSLAKKQVVSTKNSATPSKKVIADQTPSDVATENLPTKPAKKVDSKAKQPSANKVFQQSQHLPTHPEQDSNHNSTPQTTTKSAAVTKTKRTKQPTKPPQDTLTTSNPHPTKLIIKFHNKMAKQKPTLPPSSIKSVQSTTPLQKRAQNLDSLILPSTEVSQMDPAYTEEQETPGTPSTPREFFSMSPEPRANPLKEA